MSYNSPNKMPKTPSSRKEFRAADIPNMTKLLATTSFDDTSYLTMENPVGVPPSSPKGRPASSRIRQAVKIPHDGKRASPPYDINPSTKKGKSDKPTTCESPRKRITTPQIPPEAQVRKFMVALSQDPTQGYSVSDELMTYLLSSDKVASIEVDTQLNHWFQDEWANLREIPIGLEYGHFAVCLKGQTDKDTVVSKLLSARKNYLALLATDQSTSLLDLPKIAKELNDLNQSPYLAQGYMNKIHGIHMESLKGIVHMMELSAHESANCQENLFRLMGQIQSVITDVHNTLSAKMDHLTAFLQQKTGKDDTGSGIFVRSITQPPLSSVHGSASRREMLSDDQGTGRSTSSGSAPPEPRVPTVEDQAQRLLARRALRARMQKEREECSMQHEDY